MDSEDSTSLGEESAQEIGASSIQQVA